MNRRQQILEFIKRFWTKHGCSPTELEIAEDVGLSQTAVRYHLARMVECGQLKKIAGGHRSLALPTETQSAV